MNPDAAEPPVQAASATPACPACGAEVLPDDGFCEACGADLKVRRAEPVGDGVLPCPACGSTEFTDRYCDQCGRLAPSARDRVERDLGAVAGVSDKGLRHSRNEDAMALAVLGADTDAPATVVVVCDGVSTSDDPDRASQIAADTALDDLVASMRGGGPALESTGAAIEAAQRAVLELAEGYPDRANAPSCTIVAAVIQTDRVTVGWVGDSRAYWLAGADGQSARLTDDDTWAGQLVAEGDVDEGEAYKAPHAHAILRWLGPDAPEEPPNLREFVPDGPGLVLVCSDGLWNYVWDAADLSRLAAGGWGGLAAGAASLTAVALDGGGQDNITVVLAASPPRTPEPVGDTATIELPEITADIDAQRVPSVEGSDQ
ncbi:MAG TPA: PP2C family serine/threonine-protein phosphatase [Actinocrinis sp.]|uniref:PP2C family serine/threonine-protein phosphatase n=1 Tax=Actinocrinis sp. TaxID=1920516 RepID=UPI002DDCBD21|nr:PP2C family serine/threonine-protein phosphatase [Actinocrinis sp.]HEV3169718.1 PP2C family serine/threonine-protein phosphatase [Actinocrinis sp.]